MHLLAFFQHKYWHISDINGWTFNETLTNDVVSFEQLGPDVLANFAYLHEHKYNTASDYANLKIAKFTEKKLDECRN